MVATSKMERLGDVIVHSNDDDTYVLATNPGLWLVVAAAPSVLGDDIPGYSMAHMRAAGVDGVTLEQYKAAVCADVFLEYKAIQNSAERHHIPSDCVRVLIGPSPASYLEKLSSHTRVEEIPLTGAALADVMVNDVWPHSTHPDYVAWFHSTHPDFVATLSEDAPPPDDLTF